MAVEGGVDWARAPGGGAGGERLLECFAWCVARGPCGREGRARKARAAAGSRAGSLKAGNVKSSGDSDVMEEKVMIVRSGHRNSDMVVGEKLCKSKYSPYCVDDIEDVEAAQQVDQNASKVPSSSGMATSFSLQC